MWYYIKSDKTKVGPISDPSLADLLKSGEITPRTQVWTRGFKQWCELSQTDFYHKTVGKKPNYKLADFKLRTGILRITMTVIILLLGFKIFLTVRAMELHQFAPETIFEIVDMPSALRYNEILLMQKVVSVVVLGWIAAFFVLFAGWLTKAGRIAKAVKSFSFVPSRLVWLGCIIPVVNAVAIPPLTRRIFGALELAATGLLRRRTTSRIFTGTWTIVWAFACVATAFNFFVVSATKSPEIIDEIYLFGIYTLALWVVFFIATLALVSKVLGFAEKRLGR